MGAELQGDKNKDKWTFTFVNVGDFYIRECVNINNMRYITKLYGFDVYTDHQMLRVETYTFLSTAMLIMPYMPVSVPNY